MTSRLSTALWASVLAVACACSGEPAKAGLADTKGTGDSAAKPGHFTLKTDLSAVTAGSLADVTVLLSNAAGQPAPNVTVSIDVGPSSGSVATGSAVTDAQGRVTFPWLLGPVPIAQTLHLQAPASEPLEVTATTQLAQPFEPKAFAKIDPFLAARGWDGSTEDMAMAPDGTRAVLGVPGHFLQLDPSGDVTELVATGEKFGYPLGMQFGDDGTLYFCDSEGHALRKLTPARVVETLTTSDGQQPLIQPNDLTLDALGRVWFTDPCLGEVLRYDPVGKSTTVLATFNLGEQGGPNGIALSPDGKEVSVTTENVTLTCGKGGAPISKPLGRLWRADRSAAALTFAPRGAAMGIFGDGCTYDKLGNLYATFDDFTLVPEVALKASSLLVWPRGTDAPQAFLQSKTALFANPVFGKGNFGVDQLYLVLLAVAPVTEARGVQVFKASLLAP